MRILIILIGLTFLSCRREKVVEVKWVDQPTEKASLEELIASYERPDRSDWQKPYEVLSFLGKPTDSLVVAEIGAGSGYFTFRMLPKVQKVIAIDIDKRMLDFIDSTKMRYLDQDLQERLETRLVQPQNPMLKPGEVDVVFLSNTYSFLEDRVAYFSDIRKLLKPKGKVIIIDFKKRIIPVGPETEDKIALYRVEEEMRKAGFNQVLCNDQLLPYQYIVLALTK